MTPDETTRIEFAERQGYTWSKPVFNHDGKWHVYLVKGPRNDTDSSWAGKPDSFGNCEKDLWSTPNPTDRNHVHAALMGMSPEEKERYAILLLKKVTYWNGRIEALIVLIIEIPLSYQVESYLEATKGRLTASAAR